MAARQSLVGQRFSSLRVIKRVPNDPGSHRGQWLCQCDCGKRRIVRTDKLKFGKTNHCGARKHSVVFKHRALWDERIGERRGKLILISTAVQKGSSSHQRVMLKCLCECGAFANVFSWHWGKRKACVSCVHSEAHTKHRFKAGQKFGLWTVVDPKRKRADGAGHRAIKVKCACEKIRLIRDMSLVHGQSKSCGGPGCLKIVMDMNKRTKKRKALSHHQSLLLTSGAPMRGSF